MCKHLERSRHIPRAPYAGLCAEGLKPPRLRRARSKTKMRLHSSLVAGTTCTAAGNPPCYREVSLVRGTQTGGESGMWGRRCGAQISAEQKLNRRGHTRAPRPGITRMGCITGTPSPCSEEPPGPPSEHQAQLGPPLPLPPGDAHGPQGQEMKGKGLPTPGSAWPSAGAPAQGQPAGSRDRAPPTDPA